MDQPQDTKRSGQLPAAPGELPAPGTEPAPPPAGNGPAESTTAEEHAPQPGGGYRVTLRCAACQADITRSCFWMQVLTMQGPTIMRLIPSRCPECNATLEPPPSRIVPARGAVPR